MKYSINKTNHCDFKTVEIGRYAPRAYFVPHRLKADAVSADWKTQRFESDMVTVLSGEWEFKYYAKKSKLPAVIDTDKIKFDKIDVPCTWQRTGYENPAYINCPYEFDPKALGVPQEQHVSPPDLPEDFSCGVYRKCFDLYNPEGTYILTFLGVRPCLDLYVNGQFVGYGEAAHNSYEFDITKYLKEGENEIVAVVFKWCNASYLEAQDMFRENGIFRDVLLTSCGKTFISDYEALPHKNGKKYDLAFKANVKGALAGCTVKLSLCDGETVIKETEIPAEKDTAFTFKSLSVEEWSAEVPKLYELYITLLKDGCEVMTIRNYTGFKTIEIKDAVFYFNGQKIKLKGVNHHDTHETKGYAMSFEDLERDVVLMEQFNVNCVRTSHYPPDEFFLELCDHYGLYVVDEADIETHGLWSLGCDGDDVSHNLKWANRYTDRVRRMYYRDRSHAAVTMWSLGNESHGYKCHDKCYKMLKEELKTEIPVHYEGVSRTRRYHYDVFSEMYTHPDDLIKVREGKRGKQYKEVPFYLCEYCHAMGVGPGALEEYFEIFNSSDIFMGGCIWEWADHSVRHVDDGFKYEYTYGGDHGEKLHDGCFCVDGLFYPDRTPHTGALEMKAVYRPVRAAAFAGNKLTLFNTNYFRSSSYIEVYWELQQNGEVTDCGTFSTDIAPRKEAAFKLDIPKKLDASKNIYLNLTYLDGDFEIASEQITVNEAPFDLPLPESGKISATSDDGKLTVAFGGGSIVFSEETGEMLSYKKDGISVLKPEAFSQKGFALNLARAYVDNDRNTCIDWEKHNLSDPQIELEAFCAEVKGGIASVSENLCIYGRDDALFSASVLYIIGANGIVDIEVTLTPAEGSSEAVNNIPRLGLTFEADKKFSQIEYFGRGEHECLCDFKEQSPVGLYTALVADEHEPYVRPQDNSNHCDTSYLILKDGKGSEILIYSDKKFTFNVHNYTQKLLLEADHREDVHDEGLTFVTLDGFTRGTGTNSCGPQTLPQYAIDSSKELSFNFVIAPRKNK